MVGEHVVNRWGREVPSMRVAFTSHQPTRSRARAAEAEGTRVAKTLEQGKAWCASDGDRRPGDSSVLSEGEGSVRAAGADRQQGLGPAGLVGYGKGFVFYSKCALFKCSILAEVIIRFILLEDHSDCWVENGSQGSRVEGANCITFLRLPHKLLSCKRGGLQ